MKNSIAFYKTIAWAGFLVGLLDISGAFINFTISYHRNPVRVLYFIASGVWGKSAFSGNPLMAFYGLILHFIIAYLFTVFFFLIYPCVPILSRNRIVTGIGYGLFIWLVMNLIVVPLSNTQKSGFDLVSSLIGAGILILAIGIPLSFIAAGYYVGKNN